MLIDIHVHMTAGKDSKETFVNKLGAAGVDKAVLLSRPPASFGPFGPAGEPNDTDARLKALMEWAAYSDKIVPFYWINPLEEDAPEQVDKAVKAGVKGFKVICNGHYPCEARPMQIWELIAKAGKPMLFHSGILYSNGPNSIYNRPAGFEALFDIPGLKFALAHVSWPWHDECLAVYGYWQSRKRGGKTTAEMFIDTTPGTPKIYRNEVFSKIYGIGYDITGNILFGTDCVSDYNPDYTKSIIEMDNGALDACGVCADTREKYYGMNALRFLGM